MELLGVDKKLIELAEKHKEYDEEIAIAELKKLQEYDIVSNLWAIHQDYSTGDKNPLNSWLAYYIGVTTSRPTGTLHLEKRRTYGRVGFPDIDMDFDYMRRHEIIEYLIEKYGRDRVGNIGTVQTLKTKAALRKVIKVLDPTNTVHYTSAGKIDKDSANDNFELENKILKTLPSQGGFIKDDEGNIIKTVEEAYQKFDQFRRYMDAYPQVKKYASRLEGTISAFGCLSQDTAILTKEGYIRIDQLDNKVPVAFVDQDKQIRYAMKYVAHKTGNKKCYKMKLSNGCWIKVTDEHLIYTDKGCVFFKEIRKNPDKYKVLSIKE